MINGNLQIVQNQQVLSSEAMSKKINMMEHRVDIHIEEINTMEHRDNIDIEEIEPTAQMEIESTAQRMNKDVLGMSPSLPKCCIYRVHEGLRRVKPEAYEPELVSIGAYHLQNGKLQEMKKHKQRYLHLLLKRRGEKSVEKYILALKDLEARARECYADPIDLSSDKFLEMMLLDGCFVIEFFRKRIDERLFDAEDPILKVSWMLSQISSDIMLLENQLPFFILSRLYDMTKDSDQERPFIDAVLEIDLMVPKPRRKTIPNQKINHLLHLLHILCCPLPIDKSSERSTENSDNNKITRIRCVEELREAGVEFKKVGKFDTDTSNLFDIKFRKGSMEIPCFTVEDSTETFFRNLIAYEQHSSNVRIQYFTDFASFMNQLIDTEKDVRLLCRKKIIMNRLGDDKEVSDLFNKLHDGLLVSPKSYYVEVCREVNKHCDKRRYRVMERLRHDYFNNPWAGVSTIAATMLLLLTLLQTIATLKAM